MANITKMELVLRTGTSSGAGTDGDVFLAIGGREFAIDSSADDFEAGSNRTYVMGASPTIANPSHNDPRSPYQLKTETLSRFPAYLRFEPKSGTDNWQLEEATVIVNPGPNQIIYRALSGGDKLFMGRTFGKQVFLLPA